MGAADHIPVTVLTGFLGSGKTTVLNHLLRQPELNGVVAIINEFGEVALDHLLVESSEDRLALLDNGCICCSVREDLIERLADLASRRAAGTIPPFHRVLVETTGLADPVPVLHTLMTAPGIVGRYRIDGVVATVDAVNGAHTLDAHPEAIRQIAVADRLLVTKTDLASGDALARLDAQLAAISPVAVRHHVRNGMVDPAKVLDAGLFDPAARSADVVCWFEAASQAANQPHHHAHHHCEGENCGHHSHQAHDQGVSSYSLIIDEPIRRDAFARWLDYVAALKGEDLLRFKAIVNVAEQPDAPIVVHGVQHVFHPPITLDGWPSADRRSRLVFIVRGIPRQIIENTLCKFAAVSRTAIQRSAA
ncbi:GTP-binding protein [Bradyrhizobium sp. ISRA443]|uniref:CobW family GTP-binding protein n=1 Tax=unclassified Bradyrhizobium TaxID=2631580 RepID=UPI00247931E6|nr:MULTISPECIES: GTP-binding protein [unclassified Bradyrhizobium]WGR92719.1 GTP-binding protein [Bradyrhizobium sp. ISRA435]WGR97169.1 GTP-binding protein [Bradyrhizobium sp. ISRA436]WGS04057.1 GTP-binding protein [Bradyrhizobium sp. ISRA437]WGS10940.1 GTP-binding protein [Bradyrhizobium sp. ISRA443]